MSAIATVIPTETISAVTDKAFLRRAMRQTTQAIKMCKKETIQMERALERAHQFIAMYRDRAEKRLRNEGAKKRQDLIKSEEWAIRAQNIEATLHKARADAGVHAERFRLMTERERMLHQNPNTLFKHAHERLWEQGKLEYDEKEQPVEPPIVYDGPAIHVHLLSGDILPVHIGMNMPISTFAEEFAHQNRYHPTSVTRMIFLIQKDQVGQGGQEEKEEKEEQEGEVFWPIPSHHTGLTYKDLFPDEVFPLLHLFIQSMSREKAEDKIELLRTILVKSGLYNMYQDEELFTLYSTWHLTYIPPKKDNRYLTLEAFVRAHPETFWPMSEEEKGNSREWNARYKGAKQFHRFMARDEHRIQVSGASELFSSQREMIRTVIQTRLASPDEAVRASIGELLDQSPIRTCFSLNELIALGIPMDVFARLPNGYSCDFLGRLSFWLEELKSFTFITRPK